MSFRGWEKSLIQLANGYAVEAICPVIISASRATDIPAFFPEWLTNRLKAGHTRWVNPFNAKQIQYISFRDTRVIVFWSKNPQPLIPYLPEIDAKDINYYFQFTLNDYEAEGLEPNVGPLLQRIETFQALAQMLGKKRVIWRFDPLLLTDKLNIDTLLERIARIADKLKGYTEKLVISFADIGVYKKVQANLNRANVQYREFTPQLMSELAHKLTALNHDWGLEIATCAESVNLTDLGIKHNRCIDDDLMLELFGTDRRLMEFLGYTPDLFAHNTRQYLKDKGQRKVCGCIASKDIGSYDTCNHLCTYCYANTSQKSVEANIAKHDPLSDMLIP
jgi:DNA repair photolyase